jgi:cyanate permease
VVLAIGFLYFLIGHGFANWLPNILEVGGLPPTEAGLIASIPLIVGIPAVLIIPAVITKHQRKYLLGLTTLLMGVVLLFILRLSDYYLMAALFFWGILSSYGMPVLILTLMDIPEIGSRYMGSVGGLLFCIGEMGGFLGPLIIGIFKDLAGNFSTAMLFLAIISFIATSIVLLLNNKQETVVGNIVNNED